MSHTPSHAILLAAGTARRLGQLTSTIPKCLLEVGNQSLIEHQVSALQKVGITRITVVTGYYAKKVQSLLGSQVEYVINEIYDSTNSLYSLHLALQQAEGSFLLMNADVLLHNRLLDDLINSPSDDALLYEPIESLGEEEMKVRVEEGRVTGMSKTMEEGDYQGENLGVLKFSSKGASLIRAAASRLIDRGELNAWAPMVFDRICGELPISAVSSNGLPWIEIDFPEDLKRARQDIWPKIEDKTLSCSEEGHA